MALALILPIATSCGTPTDYRDDFQPAAKAPDAPPPTAAAPVVTGALEAADQVFDGSRVVVSSATIAGAAGFVILHSESKGGPGAVVGHAAVPIGRSTDIVILLDKPVEPGPYWAMLHRDGGKVGSFEWPGGPDGPVRGSGLSYVQTRIILTAPGELP